jgi:hypothetical protein
LEGRNDFERSNPVVGCADEGIAKERDGAERIDSKPAQDASAELDVDLLARLTDEPEDHLQGFRVRMQRSVRWVLGKVPHGHQRRDPRCRIPVLGDAHEREEAHLAEERNALRSGVPDTAL